MTARPTPTLPQFVRDLLSSPPHRGEGLNFWLYRVARVLHPYRCPAEIIELLRAATSGKPVKTGEIERAVVRSSLSAWPKLNLGQREAVIASGAGLVDL